MQLVSNDSRKEDISEREPILCQPDISQTSEECEIAAVGGDCIVVSEDLEEINVDETSHLVNADHPQCRICLDNEGDDLIAPCHCRGTQKYVHRSCLDNWRSTKEGFAFAHCTECRALFILRANVPPDRWWLRLKFQFLVARDHAFIFVIVQLDTRSDVDGVKITDLVFTIKSDSAERKLIAELKKDLESLKACNSLKNTLRKGSLVESIGYQIGLESKCSSKTWLLVYTTSMLLRQLVQDLNFNSVNQLLVDEIHERCKNEDFLLIILHDYFPWHLDNNYLFECHKVVTSSKSVDLGNEEYTVLDDNKYIGDPLVEVKAAKD
ncbi:hypothetical protein Goshw_020694 [Gossypium schwendimanii]|uniref:RING-CH-type domain-containing protein n=1 Tax=Gossypium schwendimanii TaxID=34291 RepID=A0A7J9MCU9_GOSSC|nr:hypothetical protein [Gossypium schwendimanii]